MLRWDYFWPCQQLIKNSHPPTTHLKCNPLSPVILTPAFFSQVDAVCPCSFNTISAQRRLGGGAVLACVGTSASWYNSGVTETDDCVKAASPEGFQSSSPLKPTTPWALFSHAPYCNDLMLIQDQRPRTSIYIRVQETGKPPEPVDYIACLYFCICVHELLPVCVGVKASVLCKSGVILLSHLLVLIQRVSPSGKLISQSEKVLQDDVWMASSQFSPLAAANEIETTCGAWKCFSWFCCSKVEPCGWQAP